MKKVYIIYYESSYFFNEVYFKFLLNPMKILEKSRISIYNKYYTEKSEWN